MICRVEFADGEYSVPFEPKVNDLYQLNADAIVYGVSYELVDVTPIGSPTKMTEGQMTIQVRLVPKGDPNGMFER